LVLVKHKIPRSIKCHVTELEGYLLQEVPRLRHLLHLLQEVGYFITNRCLGRLRHPRPPSVAPVAGGCTFCCTCCRRLHLLQEAPAPAFCVRICTFLYQ
jgi:hypothetical protein